jgi:hypothetical protein
MKALLMVLLACQVIAAQQIGDSTYNTKILNPEYAKGEGPVIFIDEGHNNFHTITGRYKPFAEVLEKDGYIVKPYDGAFSTEKLNNAAILVISNALNERNIVDWTMPVPSAFTQDEINQVNQWVKKGGSLFLIADHMPFPGAAGELAASFGFKLVNGFVFDTTQKASPDLFTKKDGTLRTNIITEGRNSTESVDSIYSFTGEGFQIPEDALPVLILNKNFVAFMPDTAWSFNKNTPKQSAGGWSQGAVSKYGNGRIAVWGEAAMFSAQTANNRKFGLNAPYAKYNLQLLLNIIHWLDGKLN